MNGFSRLNITPGDTSVVFGCGPIGLLFAQLARASGARVACVEVKENRMAIARKLGLDVYAAGPDVKEKLVQKWGLLMSPTRTHRMQFSAKSTIRSSEAPLRNCRNRTGKCCFCDISWTSRS